jgi:hypothetical protein
MPAEPAQFEDRRRIWMNENAESDISIRLPSLRCPRRLAVLSALTLPLVFVAAGCISKDGGGAAQPVEFHDEGRLCVYPATETQGVPVLQRPDAGGEAFTYAAGEIVNVAVQFPACLSSSCSIERAAICTVEAIGGTIRVTSTGSYREVDTSGACTGDCGFLIARCATTALAAGSYSFQHGSDQVALAVPFTGDPPCVGRAF